MSEEDPRPPTPRRRPNSFQLVFGILTAAAGIRANSARGSGFAQASTLSILGAVLIFCAVAGAGAWAFVHAIRSAVAQH